MQRKNEPHEYRKQPQTVMTKSKLRGEADLRITCDARSIGLIQHDAQELTKRTSNKVTIEQRSRISFQRSPSGVDFAHSKNQKVGQFYRSEK